MDDYVLTEADVHPIVNKFCDCSVLLENREKLGGALGLLPAEQLSFPSKQHYEYFKSLLLKWISKENKKATIDKLISTLQEHSFRSVPDEIQLYKEQRSAKNGKSGKELSFGYEKERERTGWDGSSRRQSSASPSYDALLPLIFDGKLKEAFQELKLGDYERVRQVVAEFERASVKNTNKDSLVKFLSCLSEFGRHNDAVHICKQYMHAYEQSFETERELLEIEFEKGTALLGLKRSEEAEAVFRKIHRSEGRLGGEKDQLVLSSKVEYAMTLSDCGRNKDALDSLEDTIKVLDTCHPPPEALILKSQLYLAIILSRLGQGSAAIQSCIKVLHDQEMIGNEHMWTVQVRHHLAIIYFDMKMYDEALGLFHSCKKTMDQLDFPPHPISAQLSYRIAEIHSAQGRNLEAYEILNEIIEYSSNGSNGLEEDWFKIKRSFAQVCSRLGEYSKALDMYDRVLKSQENSVGIEHPSVLETKFQKGMTLSSMKLFDEALDIFTKIHKTQGRTLKEDHPSLLRTKSHIALIHLELGDYREAEKRLTDVIHLQEKLDKTHMDTLRSKRCLAQTLTRLDEMKGGAEMLEEVRRLQTEVLGKEHPSTLETGFQLGVSYKLGRRADEAMSVLHQVYKSQVRSMKDVHPLALITQIELGIVNSELGNHKLALELLDDVFTKIQSDESQLSKIDVWRAKLYRGQVLSRLGRHREGLDELGGALKGQTDVLGLEHPDTLETKYQIGLAHSLLHSYEEAMNVFLKVLAAQTRVLGTGHSATLNTKTDLARVYSETGDNVVALDMFHEIEECFQKSPKAEGDTNRMRSQRYRALTLVRLGRFDEALKTLTEVKKVQEKHLGREHPSLFETMYQIGEVYKQSGKGLDALDTWNSVLNLQTNVLTQKHPQTLKTQVSILGIPVSGKPGEGVRKLNELVRNCESVLGEEHRTTMTAKRFKAQALSNNGEHAKAIELFKVVRSVQERDLGMQHPSTLETIFQLAVCQKNKGQTVDAQDNFQFVLRIRDKILPPTHPGILATREYLKQLGQKKIRNPSGSQ